METGGQPFKKKDNKFLGGSMHEEGQLRTGIRQFLQSEYKNGRINLDKTDAFRVLKYSPMSEDDPILVFKKIYGDEAYKKAGSFPGAFEIGENFKHYEKIFRENMGEDLLKVKNEKYVGDGKLVLTEAEEVHVPKEYDDDIPFAKGGRASFVGGKLVDEIIAMILKKEPVEAMKEVNKIIGKKGKYKNLTDEDINRIVDQSNDWIFQRDPDNLYVEGTIKQGDEITSENFGSSQFAPKKGLKIKKEKSVDDMNFEESLTTMEGLGATQTAERFRLKQKYPGITDDLVDKILIDDNPQRKAELIAALDEAFIMMGKGKGPDEIVEIFKNQKRTKNAKGGRAGYQEGGGIESRLEQLGGDVTSAEKLLQELNQRLETAGSSVPEGGGATAPAGSGIFAGRPVDIGGLIPGQPIGTPGAFRPSTMDLQPTLGQPLGQPLELSTPDPATHTFGVPNTHWDKMAGFGVLPYDLSESRGPRYNSIEAAYNNAQDSAMEMRRTGRMDQGFLDGEMSFDDYKNNFTFDDGFITKNKVQKDLTSDPNRFAVSSYHDTYRNPESDWYRRSGESTMGIAKDRHVALPGASQQNLQKALPGLFAQGGLAKLLGE
jgi:hypothetical protein